MGRMVDKVALKFNSSPMKNDGWKMILSFWDPVTSQGELLIGGYIYVFSRILGLHLAPNIWNPLNSGPVVAAHLVTKADSYADSRGLVHRWPHINPETDVYIMSLLNLFLHRS